MNKDFKSHTKFSRDEISVAIFHRELSHCHLNTLKSVQVKVKVTLRLTVSQSVSQSVSLGVELHLGLMTRYLAITI
jgi:hypothetical protein